METIISVIIPIYNVEHYIERCVRTLFEQTFDSIEYVFVNDCTPDNSIAILNKVLDEYPNRKENVHIINHESNQGVSCSRIDGMKAATGEYIIHCDSDDWLDLDLYEKMYNAAKTNDADIVTCDFINEFSDCSHVLTASTIKGTPKEMLANMHNNSFYCMLWRSMIRRSFIEKHNLYPLPHVDLWEDVCVTLPAYYYANKVVRVEDSFYHYFVNTNSITANSAKPKHYQDQKATVEFLESFFKDKNDIDTTLLISFWKLLAKSSFLTRAAFNPSKWQSEYPEINRHILQIHSISFKNRLLYKVSSISTIPVRLLMLIKQ